MDAFLVPQWGGVIVYNIPANTSHLEDVPLHDVFATIVHQLKLLFGLEERKVIIECASYTTIILSLLYSILLGASFLHQSR